MLSTPMSLRRAPLTQRPARREAAVPTRSSPANAKAKLAATTQAGFSLFPSFFSGFAPGAKAIIVVRGTAQWLRPQPEGATPLSLSLLSLLLSFSPSGSQRQERQLD